MYREWLYNEAAAPGLIFPNIIQLTAYISPRAHIGSGCLIQNNAVKQNNARCGSDFIINTGTGGHQDSTIRILSDLYKFGSTFSGQGRKTGVERFGFNGIYVGCSI